ncbi:MAG TPA: hypothetical protein VIS99_14630 [Terrimicrobiaceae bacterium]
MKNFDEEAWVKTKSLLRKNLTAPSLEHPDFINSRVLEEIERLKPRNAPAIFPLNWLAWSGVTALVVAGLLTLFILPQQAPRRSDAEFFSQVISARAELPQLSVSQFRTPDHRGVVLWIEGAEFIPAEKSVR